MEYKLKPCPFCGTTEYLSVNSVGSMLSSMPGRPSQVHCSHLDCEGVYGPIQYGHASAIEAWNQRETEKRAIGQGMAIAAGIIMKAWGDDVQAGEILGAAGYDSIEDMRNDGVDQYDIDLCAPVFGGGSDA